MSSESGRVRKWYNPPILSALVFDVQKLFQLAVFSVLFACFATGCSGLVVEEATKYLPTATAQILTQSHEEPTITPIPIAPTETVIETDLLPIPAEELETVIAFTGVIAPARCVQSGIDEKGSADYIYENVRHILDSADITIGVYNATIRSNVQYMGCVRSWELIGSPINADALKNAGFDLVSVATNHIKDCGFRSCGDAGFLETLENFGRVGIETVGAGIDLSSALSPVIIEVNDVRFGFISLGEVNERVFAGNTTPGIAPLSRQNLQNAINDLKVKADVLIVMPHSGPEDYPEVTPQQKYWARHSVADGANLVVINHAHILQGHQLLDGIPVFYSLGNFVFDQVWARDHQQGAILVVRFVGDQIVGYELIPTIVEQDGTVHPAEGDEKQEILDRIEQLSDELQNEP